MVPVRRKKGLKKDLDKGTRSGDESGPDENEKKDKDNKMDKDDNDCRRRHHADVRSVNTEFTTILESNIEARHVPATRQQRT